jgi:hypothetical protein
MKEIRLTQGVVAVVDNNDYEWLSQWKWHARKAPCGWYAKRTGTLEDGKPATIQMHVAIMQPPAGLDVDHIDGNGLNNTRANLRLATRAENTHNRNRAGNNTSGYKGVHLQKGNGKRKDVWRARITVNGRRHWIGDFNSPQDAAHAYDAAARKAFGEFAKTNFPLEVN